MSLPRASAREPAPRVSRRFSKPSVTPVTMFAIRLRVRPCSARCSPRSVGRVTTTFPSSFSTAMSRGLRSSSDPRGPLTRTTSGSIATSTPVGSGMGCLPMRLTGSSPDVGDDLAADALAARLVAGHHALRRGQDRGAHAAEHLGDLAVVDVRAAARLRDPAHAGDDRRTVLGVLQPDPQHLADPAGLLAVVLDVALLAEHARHLQLQLRGRDVHGVVIGLEAVADPREEVGYGVGHRHFATSWTWSGR